MRKPKKHPVYNIDLVGIPFGERWNIVQQATESELKMYIRNWKHIQDNKYSNRELSWWERKTKIVNETTQNIYLRKTWRKRHSESYHDGVIYKVDKHIQRYNIKLSPRNGNGIAQIWAFDRSQRYNLEKGTLLVFTGRDELGNIYFSKLNEITAPHQYAFNRDNKQLGYITPMEP